jgi:hypothetical protein
VADRIAPVPVVDPEEDIVQPIGRQEPTEDVGPAGDVSPDLRTLEKSAVKERSDQEDPEE